MKALSLTASLLAAVLVTGSRPAAAADLDYGRVPPPDRYSAYEDPRYRDLYGPDREPPRVYSYAPPPPSYAPPPPPYGHAPPIPPGYVYKERDRYAEWGPRDDHRYGDRCLPRHEVKRRLVEDGWHAFEDLELNGNVARVRARRENGDLFRLKVDRCTGDILRADLIERHGVGPYAWRGDPRLAPRPYY